MPRVFYPTTVWIRFTIWTGKLEIRVVCTFIDPVIRCPCYVDFITLPLLIGRILLLPKQLFENRVSFVE